MRILATGASGLLGINLCHTACTEHLVVGVVNQHPLTGTPFEVIQGDLRSPDRVRQLIDQTKPDWLIHCAALANLEDCDRNPELAEIMNARMPGWVAEGSKGRCRLLHISTDAVFDGKKAQCTEEDKPHPINLYARTKLAGERNVMEVNPSALVVRVNLFGWSILGRRSLSEWFFYNLQAGKTVRGFTDVFFCPLEAQLLSEILLRMIQEELTGLYHLVGADCISKHQFAVEIAQQFGFDPTLIISGSVRDHSLTAPRAANLCLSTEKFIHRMGPIIPDLSTSLERYSSLYQQGFPQILRGYVENPAGPINPYLSGGKQ